MNNNCTNVTKEEAPLHLFLRARRRELRLTQAEVANALRVTPECVTLWESGRRRVDIAKLPRIAAVLGVDPKELCDKALKEFYPEVFGTLSDAAVPDLTARPDAA